MEALGTGVTSGGAITGGEFLQLVKTKHKLSSKFFISSFKSAHSEERAAIVISFS